MSAHAVAIILFEISSAVFLLILVVEALGKEWCDLQHFVSNKIGGFMAICSVSDFKSAWSVMKKEENFVMVPETVILADSKKVDPLKQMFLSGRAETLEDHASSWEFRKEKLLFVPFLSGRLMDFEEQAMFFDLSQQSLAEFIRQKRRENMMHDVRFIFAALHHSSFDFGRWRGWAIRTLIIGGALFVAKPFLQWVLS